MSSQRLHMVLGLCYGTRCSYTDSFMDWSLSRLSLFYCQKHLDLSYINFDKFTKTLLRASHWPIAKANEFNNNERVYTTICWILNKHVKHEEDNMIWCQLFMKIVVNQCHAIQNQYNLWWWTWREQLWLQITWSHI